MPSPLALRFLVNSTPAFSFPGRCSFVAHPLLEQRATSNFSFTLPGNEPKIAAMKQGIISAASLFTASADFLAMKSDMKRLASLAEVFKISCLQGWLVPTERGAELMAP
jgi:hypothetical protein